MIQAGLWHRLLNRMIRPFPFPPATAIPLIATLRPHTRRLHDLRPSLEPLPLEIPRRNPGRKQVVHLHRVSHHPTTSG